MTYRPIHRIVLTGGGTGGHVYPALAVAELLSKDSEVQDILYIGAAGHIEEKLAQEKGLKFVGLKISGLPRRLNKKAIVWPLQFIQALLEAKKYLLQFRPTAVLGTGGYASAPALLAAMWTGVPYAIHEPDAHPGLVNRQFARNAALVSCGMDAAYDVLMPAKGKIVVNGNPVSRNFLNMMRRDAGCVVYGLNPDLKTILITGGSQGAKAINEVLIAALPELLQMTPQIQIIHQAGEKNLAELRNHLSVDVLNNPRYVLRDYFSDLSVPYAAADLAVCRSGAMTISELAVVGCPAIFIPYPHAAADHQNHNALMMEQKGAAIVMPQDTLTAARLKEEITNLFNDTTRLERMRNNMAALGKKLAAQDLAMQVKEISTERQMRDSKKKAFV